MGDVRTGTLGNIWNVAQGLGTAADYALGGYLPNWLVPGGVTPQQVQQMSQAQAIAQGMGEPVSFGGGYPLGQPVAQNQFQMPGIGMPAPAYGNGYAHPSGQCPSGAKTFTMVVRQYPDGTVVQQKIVAGGVAVFRKDIQAVKRLKKAARQLGRLFPSRKGVRRKSSGVRIVRVKK